jgi:RHS repeat-associated protein
MYVGESFTFVPEPLDITQMTVHSAQRSWQSSAAEVAAVDISGEVTAKVAGTATLTLTIGSATATVSVQVLSGIRPKQTDAQWDAEHASDCDTPISSNRSSDEAKSLIASGNEYGGENNLSFRDLVSKAVYRMEASSPSKARPASVKTSSRKFNTKTTPNSPLYYLVPPLDGDSGYPTSSNATASYNHVGSPNYSAMEEGGSSGIRMKRNLGSYNYSFGAPILSLGGRGMGVNLALIYNSRLWNREDSGMQFNYAKGWPAAGWTFGYGRLIQDFDAVDSGNYLLIQPDGTRIPLIKVPSTNFCRSKEGSNIQLNPSTKNILYPDGTQVKYITHENRLLPNTIKTRNGDIVSISYRPKTATFPFRWAINTIQDTLGRTIVFNYYGDSGYAAGTGKPASALATVTTPDQANGSTKELIRLEYEDVLISYNFSNPPDPNEVPATLTVVKKIYYPDTGRGYMFEDFSTYGMARKISIRMGMFFSGGNIQPGTQLSYTRYNYQTNDPNDPNYQGGPLSDSPKYTERSEYWQDKTDAQGNATGQETIYRYQRMPGMLTDTVYYPNSSNDVNNYLWKVVTTTNADGSVSKVERLDKLDALLEKSETSYINLSDGGLKITEVKFTNEANETTRKTFTYYSNFGRLRYVDEYGFTPTTLQRRTEYEYLDGQLYIDARLINLVNKVRVYNGSNLTQPVALTTMFYDDYTGYPHGGGMEFYGLNAQTMPFTHSTGFNQDYNIRGNVTMTRSYTDIGGNAAQDRWSKYDIFGNVVEAEVSCCQVKSSTFSGTHWWSKPDSITSGNVNGTHLTTTMQYNFNTGLVTQVTDPNGQSISYVYDAAWRQDTTNLPTGATKITRPDKDGNGKDLLSYFEQATYFDVVTKTVTSRRWFNGASKIVKAGTGAGASPSSYDMSSTVYDHLGRVGRQSNPFQGTATGTGSSSFYTENTYDLLSRVKETKLPDNQIVSITYNGSTVTETDQVGRQRKSQVDGLGRIIKVTEQNPANGSLIWETLYSYDTLDKLIQVDQGGQMRQYKYDAMARLVYEKTPEQGTRNYGADGFWSVKYTYTDFNEVDTRTDARGAVTDYNYDVLHRLESITYNISNAPGVESTPQVSYTYNTSAPGNGQIHSINNGIVNEVFSYDSFGRLTSKARSFVNDANTNTYSTSYEYNAISQPTAIIYPSNKRIKTNYDLRGRLSGLDKYSGANLQATYLSGVSYNTAGQMTGGTLGNGVVEAFGYSPDRLQLSSQTATKNGNTLMSMLYTYQASSGQSGASTTPGNTGQLMGVTANIAGASRGQQFTYDNVGRLVTASGWNASTHRRFDYDRLGNRTGVWDATSSGTQIQSVILEQSGGAPTNRLTSVTTNGTTVNYAYDPNGNVTNDGNTYAYDAENRIVKVNGTAAFYAYDSNNRRVRKTIGTVTTYYIWEGGDVIAEYGNGQPQGSGGLKFYHADKLSTRMITNSSGAVVGTQDHLPFGEDAGVSGESEKHRFTKYERDATGTDYAVNRQYSNSTGRFLRPDPVVGRVGVPQSWNRYSYTQNDPVNFNDPLGLNRGAIGAGGGILWTLYHFTALNGWTILSQWFEPYEDAGSSGTVDMKALEKALSDCISQLYPIYSMTYFRPSTDPGGATEGHQFNGVIGLKDTRSKGTLEIVNDPTPPANIKAELIKAHSTGATNESNPWWTWGGGKNLNPAIYPSEKRYPELFSAPGMDFIATQIHETAAALSFIRNKYHPDSYKPQGALSAAYGGQNALEPFHGDDGPAMEDCVGSKYYQAKGMTPKN